MTNEFITAVLFDWDFTLAYTIGKDVPYDTRTMMMLHQIDIPCTLQDVQQAQQAQATDIQNGSINLPAYPQTKPDFLRVYRDLLTRLGVVNVNDELAYKLYTEYARLPTFLYDDVLSTLQAIDNCGFRLGILSNHTVSVRDTIEPLVGHLIPSEHIVISEEVGLHKPAPEIYKQAAHQVGSPPAQCIYVGDNLHVDAIGAVKHGGFARGFWLDRNDNWQGQKLPTGVTHLTNLGELIEHINKECKGKA